MVLTCTTRGILANYKGQQCLRRFLQSGADVIVTASYQASIQGFVQHLGVSVEQASQLLMSSVHLARQAQLEFVARDPPSGKSGESP